VLTEVASAGDQAQIWLAWQPLYPATHENSPDAQPALLPHELQLFEQPLS
jgi:hypothetical protein